MKNRIIIIIAIYIGSIMNVTSQQEVYSWSSLDSNAIMIGDQVSYNFGISVPENSSVKWPVFNDTLTSNIEVLERANIDTLKESGILNINQSLIITSFDSGYFELPSVIFDYKLPNDTNIYTTSTGTIFLQVFVPEVDTTLDFKPIISPLGEPYTLAEILPWALLILAILFLIVLIVWYVKKRKKKQPLFQRKPKPILPAHIEALNKLEELRLAKIWQNGKVKEYYTILTDISRNYIERRYGFDAPEMTSFEILEELKNNKVNDLAFSKMQSVLQLADLVKFAKSQPTPLENDLGLSHCVDFVNETKQNELAVGENNDDKDKISNDG